MRFQSRLQLSRVGLLLGALALLVGTIGVPSPAEAATESVGIAQACPSGEVPDAGFTDVPEDSRHALAIDCMVWRGVAAGTSATTFSPNAVVTRGQTASFAARLLTESGVQLPADPPDAFTDDNGSTHEPAINALAAVGIVQAAEEDRFQPNGRVTRADMGEILQRLYNYRLNPEATPEELSARAPAGSPAASVLTGAGDCSSTFRPSLAVPRDQLMSCLAVVLDLLQTDAPASPTAPGQPDSAGNEAGLPVTWIVVGVVAVVVIALTAALVRRRRRRLLR